MFVESRLLRKLKLLLVDVSVIVANHRRPDVVRDIHCFRQIQDLGPHLDERLIHSLSQVTKRAFSKVAAVKRCSTVPNQQVKRVNTDKKLEVLSDLGVLNWETSYGVSEDVEVNVV